MSRNELERFRALGITLKNNEIKDIIRIINSLENMGTLLKGTAKNY